MWLASRTATVVAMLGLAVAASLACDTDDPADSPPLSVATVSVTVANPVAMLLQLDDLPTGWQTTSPAGSGIFTMCEPAGPAGLVAAAVATFASGSGPAIHLRQNVGIFDVEVSARQAVADLDLWAQCIQQVMQAGSQATSAGLITDFALELPELDARGDRWLETRFAYTLERSDGTTDQVSHTLISVARGELSTVIEVVSIDSTASDELLDSVVEAAFRRLVP